MAELEKVQLLNFDIDQYLKDGDATVAACAQAKAVADEIHEQGYENIFLLGIGGTYDELDMVRYFMKKYSEVEVHLVNAGRAQRDGRQPPQEGLRRGHRLRFRRYQGDRQGGREHYRPGIRVVAFTREDTPARQARDHGDLGSRGHRSLRFHLSALPGLRLRLLNLQR